MGLCVYYRYKVKAPADEARRLVEKLRAFAATLPFDRVGEVYEYDPPDGKYAFKKAPKRDRAWKPGAHYMTRRRADGARETVCVPALHVMAFTTDVRGAETAEFGLASHPAAVTHFEDVITPLEGGGEERQIGAGAPVEVPTRLRGWYSWSQGCKTQYAANPALGGAENFLRAHLSIFRMIEECGRLGLTARIRDDGKYWKHRDTAKLLEQLARWDELVAGFVGRLSDAIGEAAAAGTFVAPIKDRPDFEHLEARGASRLHAGSRGGGKRIRRRRGKRDPS